MCLPYTSFFRNYDSKPKHENNFFSKIQEDTLISCLDNTAVSVISVFADRVAYYDNEKHLRLYLTKCKLSEGQGTG